MLMDSTSRSTSVGARRFDAICAGEATRVAMALARHDLRVGLAAVLADDSVGRSLHDQLAANGIDVGGVQLSLPASGLFFVRGGARQIVREGKEEAPVSIPEGWSAEVLVLSGMSPCVSHAAAFCKAARASRRARTTVVVDLHTRWDAWKGRDWRSIRMVLHEADVVWSSSEDLVGLSLDVASVRAAMRPGAVLATHRLGRTSAIGPFGEVTSPSKLGPTDNDDDFVAAICVELKRAGNSGGNDAALWSRALARGQAAAAGYRSNPLR